MSQSPYFINFHFPNYLCKLHETLYDVKQAPYAWYNIVLNVDSYTITLVKVID